MGNELARFDYNQLDADTAEFLKRKERNMRDIVGNAYTELGRELKEAQERLASHNKYQGMFVKWCEAIGFKPRTAYNLIQRYNLLQNLQNIEQRETIEELPVSLTYEIAKPSANEELKQKVLAGEITTLKQYRELEEKLKRAEEEKQRLARQLEQERNKPPQVVEKVVEKVVDRTDYNKIEMLNLTIQRLKHEKAQLEQKASKSEEYENELKQLKRELDEKTDELLALTQEQLRAKDRRMIYENVSYLAREVGKWMHKIRLDIHKRKEVEGDAEVHRTIRACIELLEETISELRSWVEVKQYQNGKGGAIDAEYAIVVESE